jgi:hypothetical protein
MNAVGHNKYSWGSLLVSGTRKLEGPYINAEIAATSKTSPEKR